jgi:glycosyltransferase involved in cell wall biosynthesis
VQVLAYTDSVYRERDGVVHGEIAFNLFLAELGHRVELTVVGRLDPDAGAAHYPLPSGVGFLGLPHYASLARPGAVAASLARSLRLFWRALGDVDCVWLFGPYLHAILFALLARARRRRVVLGVRQDFPAYVRRRRPGVRWMHVAADVLEGAWRALGRRCPVVVIGPELAEHYARTPRLLEIAVSLVSGADIAAGERSASGRAYEGELHVLSVGRLEEEKNPLLLADILAGLRAGDPRWRMVVCGEGPLAEPLAERLAALGLSSAVDMRGHVPLHGGLLDLYRSAHVFLHVSWTEGFPQVLVEAFASGVPVVATAVGGVPAAAGDAALLVGPGDADAAVAALQRVAADPALRAELISAGFAAARAHTLEGEVGRVAAFLAADRG